LPQQQQQQQHTWLTWVAVLLGLEVVGDAEEGAVALTARVADVHAALGLNPVEEDGLREQQRACGVC
jgi:hypothetical protein